MQVQERFRNAYQEVKTTMAQLYSFFQTDSEEVQREWLKFTQKVSPSSAKIALPRYLHGICCMQHWSLGLRLGKQCGCRTSATSPNSVY